MNYSEREASRNRTADDALVESGLRLLPAIGTALFSAISNLGHAYRLTPAQVKVLLQLGTHRQMTVGEIAAALACSMPAASELVDRLVEAGHLVRASDPADRRRVLIAATPDSERISAHLRDLREAQLRFALEQLPSRERPIFIRSLEALVAGLTHADGATFPGCAAAAGAGDFTSSGKTASAAGFDPVSRGEKVHVVRESESPDLARSSRGVRR